MGASEERSIRPLKPAHTSLRVLAETHNFLVNTAVDKLTVTGISIDSRDVRPGDLYVGVPGAQRHGAEFNAEAQQRGAVAMLTDAAGAQIAAEADLPVLVTATHPKQILGDVSAHVYNNTHIDARVFGVTGTNGKTSVVYILDALMQVAGMKTGISTTAERRIGTTSIISTLTSPEASEMHGLLARMREEQVTAIAIEVSAQAVIRHRIDGISFDLVAFNNFSHDHLDEFGDMEQYFAAKLALFDPQHAQRGVVVVDGEQGRRIARESKIPVTTLATEYGHDADWHLAVTRHTIDGVSFVLQGPAGANFRGSVPLFGSFMAENAALSLIMLHETGISLSDVERNLAQRPIPVNIPGRLEQISDGSQGPRFYVDYGHTPGSFASMLDALGEVAPKRVLFMFGADGNRDTTKREEMGRIAASGADIVIICDYHPRFEDPAAIRAQLLNGAHSAGSSAKIIEEPDPKAAIRLAISLAEDGDVILYAGPGHETHQEVAGNMVPYSAREEVRGALREVGLLK